MRWVEWVGSPTLDPIGCNSQSYETGEVNGNFLLNKLFECINQGTIEIGRCTYGREISNLHIRVASLLRMWCCCCYTNHSNDDVLQQHSTIVRLLHINWATLPPPSAYIMKRMEWWVDCGRGLFKGTVLYTANPTVDGPEDEWTGSVISAIRWFVYSFCAACLLEGILVVLVVVSEWMNGRTMNWWFIGLI